SKPSPQRPGHHQVARELPGTFESAGQPEFGRLVGGSMLVSLARWLAGVFPGLLERSPLVKNLVSAPGQRVAADALQWNRRFWPAGWYMAELKVSSAHAGNEAVLVAQSKGGKVTGRFALPLA